MPEPTTRSLTVLGHEHLAGARACPSPARRCAPRARRGRRPSPRARRCAARRAPGVPSVPIASADRAAQRIARAGPSKVARKPSPVRLTSRPRWRSSARRKSASWRSSRTRQSRSPSSAARSVEPHDVGEQHGREHAVGLALVALAGEELLDLADDDLAVAQREHVVAALELDEARVRDVARPGSASARS